MTPASARRKLIASLVALAMIVGLIGLRALLHTDPLERLEATTDQQLRGSWKFPRGGPYVLGFQCDRDCELRIDGERVASGRGLILKRVVFAAGVYDVEFDVASRGRLLWHPPGRRGPPEYVPSSSLSPQSAGAATFSGAGASRADGLIALAILAVLIATLAVLLVGVFPPPGPGGGRASAERARWIEVAVVFAVALAVRLLGLGDAGQTWDEDVNWSAGRNYVTNLLGLEFGDDSWRWNLEHPPLMKLMVGIGAQFADGYGPARAISAAMMSLACALMVPICARLGLARAGLYAGVIAALSPHLIGHGQIVGHESAMALSWLLAICAAVCVWPSGEGSRLEVRLAVVGAAVGLAIAARFVNGLVGPLVFAIVVLRAPLGRRFETAWKAALIMPVAAVAVFVALWPRMWSHPIAHLGEAWEVLKKPHLPEPFLGQITNTPPRAYFAIYLAATAPLGLLAAAAGGLGWLAARRRQVALVAALWLGVPMLVMFSPVRQDGIRYIIPSLFALALLAGIGVAALGERLATARTRLRGRLPAAPVAALGENPATKMRSAFTARLPAALLVAYLAVVSAAIRPYFIDYYGEHVGGPSAVAAGQRFEIGWWGEGLAEALEYVNANAPEGARVHKECVAPSHLAWLRGDLWKSLARRAEDADWMLVYSAGVGTCKIPQGFELAFEASARGAPLARVYRRRR